MANNTLPLWTNAASVLQQSLTPGIQYIDPRSGIYLDVDNTWYLNNGTPINTYDPNTGAYQEQDGTWYTFQGVPLMNYNTTNGSYQEDDGTWYNSNGSVMNPQPTNVPTSPNILSNILSGNNILYIGGAALLLILLTSKSK